MRDMVDKSNSSPRRAVATLLQVTAALVGISLLALWLGAGATAERQGQTVVRSEPSPAQVERGGTAAVDIRIENVTGLYGAEVTLNFDPALLEVQDADPVQAGVQIQPGSFPHPDFVVVNNADNEAGSISYAVSQMPPHGPVGGNGVLATITFKGLELGTSPLSFVKVKLVNRDGIKLPAQGQDGEVVVMESVPTPVPTPIGARACLTPSSQEISVGMTTTVDVRIEDVTDLWAVELTLSFDPELLEVQDADPEQEGVQIQPGSFPYPDVILQNSADNDNGIITYAVMQTNPRPPAEGSGVLATITFKGLKGGTSPLTLVCVVLGREDSSEIPVYLQDGQISVETSVYDLYLPFITKSAPTS